MNQRTRASAWGAFRSGLSRAASVPGLILLVAIAHLAFVRVFLATPLRLVREPLQRSLEAARLEGPIDLGVVIDVVVAARSEIRGWAAIALPIVLPSAIVVMIFLEVAVLERLRARRRLSLEESFAAVGRRGLAFIRASAAGVLLLSAGFGVVRGADWLARRGLGLRDNPDEVTSYVLAIGRLVGYIASIWLAKTFTDALKARVLSSESRPFLSHVMPRLRPWAARGINVTRLAARTLGFVVRHPVKAGGITAGNLILFTLLMALVVPISGASSPLVMSALVLLQSLLLTWARFSALAGQLSLLESLDAVVARPAVSAVPVMVPATPLVVPTPAATPAPALPEAPKIAPAIAEATPPVVVPAPELPAAAHAAAPPPPPPPPVETKPASGDFDLSSILPDRLPQTGEHPVIKLDIEAAPAPKPVETMAAAEIAEAQGAGAKSTGFREGWEMDALAREIFDAPSPEPSAPPAPATPPPPPAAPPVLPPTPVAAAPLEAVAFTMDEQVVDEPAAVAPPVPVPPVTLAPPLESIAEPVVAPPPPPPAPEPPIEVAPPPPPPPPPPPVPAAAADASATAVLSKDTLQQALAAARVREEAPKPAAPPPPAAPAASPAAEPLFGDMLRELGAEPVRVAPAPAKPPAATPPPPPPAPPSAPPAPPAAAAPPPATPPAEKKAPFAINEPKLTVKDIFGDILEELGGELPESARDPKKTP